jgi:hypothetical protein
LVGWLVGWLVGRLVGQSEGWIGRHTNKQTGRQVGSLLVGLVVQSGSHWQRERCGVHPKLFLTSVILRKYKSRCTSFIKVGMQIMTLLHHYMQLNMYIIKTNFN